MGVGTRDGHLHDRYWWVPGQGQARARQIKLCWSSLQPLTASHTAHPVASEEMGWMHKRSEEPQGPSPHLEAGKLGRKTCFPPEAARQPAPESPKGGGQRKPGHFPPPVLAT